MRRSDRQPNRVYTAAVVGSSPAGPTRITAAQRPVTVLRTYVLPPSGTVGGRFLGCPSRPRQHFARVPLSCHGLVLGDRGVGIWVQLLDIATRLMPHSVVGEAPFHLVNVARRPGGVDTANDVDIWCRDRGHAVSNSSLAPWAKRECGQVIPAQSPDPGE